MPTNASPFPQPISQEIWERKYKLTTPNEDIQNDESVEDTWTRIAAACANSPITVDVSKAFDGIDSLEHAEKWFPEFYSALEDFKFLPAGRVTAGAGSGRQVTLFNCYVMGTIPDDLSGIFDMLKEAALTMQQGGGIGYDFSPIRPSGAPVKGVDADASGPLSFMDVWDAMCRTIMSAGARRGAMMATIRDDHPDVLKFIKAKREKGRLNMFNMSVLCSDEFMAAVENDEDWPLTHEVKPAEAVIWQGSSTVKESRYIYEIVRARDLWDEIMENTYNHAEPGVLFVSRINKMNNLWFIEDITSTNPCGEQPLPPYGACLLGSINLARMVKFPFSKESKYPAHIDYREIERVTRLAVRMLDSVIDTSNFPLEAQRQEALYKRRMGLGITGLADMLLMLGVEYGSPQAQDMAKEVMGTITLAAYWESIKMAREFGPCPATETFEQRSDFINSGFMAQDCVPSKMRDEIMQVGIRNALLTSIAPTGTISLYAGNVSSGVEPIFATEYMRNVLEDDGVTKVQQKVSDYAILKWREYCEMNGMDVQDPPALVTAQTLTPEDHLVMQASVQTWIDSSISKTINCPKDISFDDFKAVYLRAYELGLKGCTTYRPNDTLGSVIEIIEDKPEVTEPVEQVFEEGPGLVVPNVPAREQVLDAQVYKLKWKGKNFYVTISNQVINGSIAPFEIFINSQDMANFQWITALTRMMSSVFRRGGDISFVVEDLKSIMDPNGGEFVAGGYQHSFIAYLGKTIQLHLDRLDDTSILYEATPRPMVVEPIEAIAEIDNEIAAVIPDKCPECDEYAVVNRGGCPVCDNCGHSKCG